MISTIVLRVIWHGLLYVVYLPYCMVGERAL